MENYEESASTPSDDPTPQPVSSASPVSTESVQPDPSELAEGTQGIAFVDLDAEELYMIINALIFVGEHIQNERPDFVCFHQKRHQYLALAERLDMEYDMVTSRTEGE